MKKLTILLFFTLLGHGLYSCVSPLPHADAVHEEWARKSWGNIHLSEARKIYADNCSGCHDLHSPMEHTQKKSGSNYSAKWLAKHILMSEIAYPYSRTWKVSVKIILYDMIECCRSFSQLTRYGESEWCNRKPS